MTQHINLPPGRYLIELTHTAPNGVKTKLTIDQVQATDPQVLATREEIIADIYADDKIVRGIPAMLLRLEFDDVRVIPSEDGQYMRIEADPGKKRWRVSYVAHGTASWIDFHCKEDAETFASEGYDMGLFIQPETTEIK